MISPDSSATTVSRMDRPPAGPDGLGAQHLGHDGDGRALLERPDGRGMTPVLVAPRGEPEQVLEGEDAELHECLAPGLLDSREDAHVVVGPVGGHSLRSAQTQASGWRRRKSPPAACGAPRPACVGSPPRRRGPPRGCPARSGGPRAAPGGRRPQGLPADGAPRAPPDPAGRKPRPRARTPVAPPRRARRPASPPGGRAVGDGAPGGLGPRRMRREPHPPSAPRANASAIRSRVRTTLGRVCGTGDRRPLAGFLRTARASRAYVRGVRRESREPPRRRWGPR